MSTRYLRAALFGAMSILLCAQGALAATLAQVAADGLGLQWDVVLLSFVICTVSGVAALLQRINTELRTSPDHDLPHPILFCSAHMVGSWAAGIAAAIASQQFKFDIWASLSLMMGASYLGARWMEAWAESKVPPLPSSPPTPPATLPEEETKNESR